MVSPLALAEVTLATAINSAFDIQMKGNLSEARRKVGEGMAREGDALLSDAPEVGVLYMSDELGSQTGYREYEATLAMPVWRFGQKSASQQLSEDMLAQAASEHTAMKWQVASEVLDSVWSLREAEAAQGLALTQWESARTLEAHIKKRLDAGEVARADWILAQQETASREEKYRLAHLHFLQAETLWEGLTGLNALPSDLDSIERVEKSSLDDHPLYLNSEQMLSVARSQSKRERKSLQSSPVVTLYAKRDRGEEIDPWNESLGVQFTLPIGKAHVASDLAQAEMAVTEAMVELNNLQRSLKYQHRKATVELNQIESALALARRVDELARARVDVSERAYQMGEMELFLLLQARLDADIAANNLETILIKHKRAISLYNLSLGVLPQ
ncbi:MAG: TolC family protein [Gammaproteobacteria bacterium]|jgi:outer membrane protein TolC